MSSSTPRRGYTTAVCRVDQQDHLAAVQLSGGTRKAEGLITAVETQASGGSVLTISGFDRPAGAAHRPRGHCHHRQRPGRHRHEHQLCGSYVSLRAGPMTTAT